MIDGIYEINFRGAADWGMGMLVLKDGIITGADIGGALYDGVYKIHDQIVNVSMQLIVPPGVVLVQGTKAQPQEYSLPIETNISISTFSDNSPVLIDLPPGPVNVIFNRLRKL